MWCGGKGRRNLGRGIPGRVPGRVSNDGVIQLRFPPLSAHKAVEGSTLGESRTGCGCGCRGQTSSQPEGRGGGGGRGSGDGTRGFRMLFGGIWRTKLGRGCQRRRLRGGLAPWLRPPACRHLCRGGGPPSATPPLRPAPGPPQRSVSVQIRSPNRPGAGTTHAVPVPAHWRRQLGDHGDGPNPRAPSLQASPNAAGGVV